MRCDEGYLCDVCGQAVEQITESELYLRYVLGEVPLDRLHLHPERHLICNPALAQYISDDRFPPVHCGGPFAKNEFDAGYVAAEQERVSRGYRRLHDVVSLRLTITEYPLTAMQRDPH